MTPHSEFAAYLRAIAASLLEAALKIAPPCAADWGRAMLGELHYVEGGWSALAWSVGSAGVLAKHALFAAFVPGSTNQLPTNAGTFFAKEKPMRKSSLIIAAACLAASLLFFAVPTFKQAFRLSLAQWPAAAHAIRGRYYNPSGPDFSKLETQARKQNDADGLAFIALHEVPTEGAPLADEAVRMDSRLTWIYAVIGTRGWNYPQRAAWIPQLEKLDPQNAVPHLMEAQDIEWSEMTSDKRYPFDAYQRDPKWLNAMSAAFASPRIEIYRDRLKNLDRTIAQRYGSDLNFNDPYLAQSEYLLSQGLFSGEAVNYAKMLVASADASTARGDLLDAQKQYWLVIRFGEMWQPTGSMLAAGLLQGPYKRMASLSAKQGDENQEQLFAFLSNSIDQARQQDLETGRALWANESIERWNANILQISGLILVLCAATLLVCGILTAVIRRSAHVSKLRVGSGTSFFAMVGAVGMLFSSATLYLSYRPYDTIVRTFVRDGDPAGMRMLNMFLGDAQSPFGYNTLYKDAGIFFWTGVIALCAVALIVVAAKFAWHRRTQAVAA